MNVLRAKLEQAAGAKYGAQADFGLKFGVCRMMFAPAIVPTDLLLVGAVPDLERQQIGEILALAVADAGHRHAAPPPPPAIGRRVLASLNLTPRILAQRPFATPSRTG